MKTRKYKDNQQRKNFAKNESNILLIQYFKRYAFGSEAFKGYTFVSEGSLGAPYGALNL